MAKKLPVYSICTIKGKDNDPEEFMVSRLAEYLGKRDYLFQPHGHSFYHLVFFTRGAGKQLIDFNSFAVKPGQIYFMNPGQVHDWQFKGAVDGYIVNFTQSFFEPLSGRSASLDRFAVFSGHFEDQVIQLPAAAQDIVRGLFEQILSEHAAMKAHAADMIRTSLIQLFIIASRLTGPAHSKKQLKPGYLVVKNFQKLVDQHYTAHRLPSEYAALLYVTPNYLNALCKDLLGKPAGEVIRERIILEAKRLLLNADYSISEISNTLDFHDHSYFTKFFKKHTGKTPEHFRADYRVAQRTS